MSDTFVNLTVRTSTRNRLMTQCWTVFCTENPEVAKLSKLNDRIKTQDFVMNRVIDFYLNGGSK